MTSVMTLSRISGLRGLDYDQLINLALQRGLFTKKETDNFWRFSGRLEWSPDRLRLKLIDSIVDEELREHHEKRLDEAEGQGRR